MVNKHKWARRSLIVGLWFVIWGTAAHADLNVWYTLGIALPATLIGSIEW